MTADVDETEVDVAGLQPGDAYPGALDKRGGTYKLRQKAGGVIERRGGPRGSEFASWTAHRPPLTTAAGCCTPGGRPAAPA